MSREILQDIIENFSPDKFPRFFREKNRSFSPRQESYSQYDDESFADGLKLGEIKFSDSGSTSLTTGERLITCAFQSTRPLSERSSRKAQYEKGKKILKDTQSDAGIFIFHDTQGNFRFSLIYPEAVGTRRQWNNFRRFTYFVSPELTNKTFLTRVGEGDFTSLEKIKDAFSVEKVTKEFYEQYRKLFEALVVDLNKNRAFQMVADKNQINISNFTKKTLGQIVFLYFLQKKGWLGVPREKAWGAGDKNFTSNLYLKAVTNKENFFNDYLEILFYDTLNNANRAGADPSFSKYFDCRIPFLNGGLFEPEYDWRGTKIYLDNSVFKNIFEVFDRFNFTVEEESPDDKEVAVDPEMLGKVFENLIEENLRKGKGTYYTPREIVHYMCRESLVNYLVSQSVGNGRDRSLHQEEEKVRALILRHESVFSDDEAKTLDRLLKDVKVCDPACGSGAFLVGMLNEIIHARLALAPSGSEYTLKKETIQNCVYGVDIDPGAVEIAKLRLWLSLVVDYDPADIEPLPNLDYKIMCGNSLLEDLIVGDESIPLFDPEVLKKDKPKKRSSDKLMQMDLFKEDADEYLKILRKLHVEYFHETGTQKKRMLRSRIEKIEMDFIHASIDSRVKAIETQIRNLNMQKPEDRKKNAALMKKKLEYMAIPNDICRAKVRPYFLWHLNFFEVFQEKDGFDIVIANPPYVGEKGNKRVFREIKKGKLKQFYQRKSDLFYFFFHIAIDISRNNAAIVFITTNYYPTATQALKLRMDFQKRCSIRRLINFNEIKIFDSALGQHNMITFLNKERNDALICRSCITQRSGVVDSTILYNIMDGIDSRTNYWQISQFHLYEGANAYIRLGGISTNDPLQAVLARLQQNTIRLGDICNVNQGILTGVDKIKSSHLEKFPQVRLQKGEGVFVLSQKERSRFDSDEGIFRPWFKNSDIGRYITRTSPEEFVIYATRDLNLVKTSLIYQHFLKFEEVIKARNQERGEIQAALKQGKWWIVFAARKGVDFNGPKIVAPQRSYKNTFGYNNKPWYASADVYFITSRDAAIDLKYILALLNSKLYFVWLYYKGKRKGEMLELYQKPLSEIPVKLISQTEQKAFVDLADCILMMKEHNLKADTTLWEKQIDQMVYHLYGLTETEIEIVGGAGK